MDAKTIITGTISEGTHRSDVLIERFINALSLFNEEEADVMRRRWNEVQQHDDPDPMEDLLGDLFDKLGEYAPENHFFGAHPGDGADFGFWPDESEWFDKFGNLIKDLPNECVQDCSHAGSCDDEVEYWAHKLKFKVPREKAIDYLKEFGAWEDLLDVDKRTLAERVLWIACGDIVENGYWIGLAH